jgi:YD repeat-containing protein
MRLLVAALLLHAATASAQVAGPRDPDALRPDLSEITARGYAMRGATSVLHDVAVRTYDPAGHLVAETHRNPAGRLVVDRRQTFDGAGHLTETDERVAHVTRRFTTTVDAHGRITEVIRRDPRAPAGEDHQDVWTWNPDGSRTVRGYRRYAHEGPYPDRAATYDAAGRETSDCDVVNHLCDMPEYDDHGTVSRIRQQNAEEHFYLTYDNTYDAAGHLVEVRRGTYRTTYRYDDHDDVVEAVTLEGATVVARETFSYRRR